MQSNLDRKTHRNTAALSIKGRGPAWTPDLQLLLDRCLQRIGERFPQTIRSVAASLEDMNGPRGGVDKRCAVTLTLTGNRNVSVSACSTNAEAAVIQAGRRARNAVIGSVLGARDKRSRDSRPEERVSKRFDLPQ